MATHYDEITLSIIPTDNVIAFRHESHDLDACNSQVEGVSWRFVFPSWHVLVRVGFPFFPMFLFHAVYYSHLSRLFPRCTLLLA